MTSKKFYLRSEQIKSNLIDAIRSIQVNQDKPMVIEIKEQNRSQGQNSKLHALFGDLERSELVFAGKRRSAEEWKCIMISAHSAATMGSGEVVSGLEGELLCIRESSAKMSVKRMVSLIEYITSYCVMNGVNLRDVTYSDYDGVLR